MYYQLLLMDYDEQDEQQREHSHSYDDHLLLLIGHKSPDLLTREALQWQYEQAVTTGRIPQETIDIQCQYGPFCDYLIEQGYVLPWPHEAEYVVIVTKEHTS